MRIFRAGIRNIFIQITLDTADGHRIVYQNAALADLFARMMADVCAHRRKRIFLPDYAICVFFFSVAGQSDITLRADSQRACRCAGLFCDERIDIGKAHDRLIRTFRTYTADPALCFRNRVDRTTLPANATVDTLGCINGCNTAALK